MEKLNPFQSEIAAAVTHALQPMAQELQELKDEVTSLRHGASGEWLTVDQAAKHMGVCKATIRRRVKSGLYETRRDGGRKIMIRREDIVS